MVCYVDPDSKVHGANMGPIWVRQDPDGPHVGPMNFAIWGRFFVIEVEFQHIEIYGIYNDEMDKVYRGRSHRYHIATTF